jgi:hypothetical protein
MKPPMNAAAERCSIEIRIGRTRRADLRPDRAAAWARTAARLIELAIASKPPEPGEPVGPEVAALTGKATTV